MCPLWPRAAVRDLGRALEVCDPHFFVSTPASSNHSFAPPWVLHELVPSLTRTAAGVRKPWILSLELLCALGVSAKRARSTLATLELPRILVVFGCSIDAVSCH